MTAVRATLPGLPAAIAGVMFGVIDKVLYVSEVQKQVLAPGYDYATAPSTCAPGRKFCVEAG